MRTAWIVSIGTELALGQTVDTNSAWLAHRLRALGIRPTRHATVADEEPDIVAVLRQAADAADLVLVTGGLGPTADDLTRHALAAVAGVPLEEHAPSLAHLHAFFGARGRMMPPANAVQALIPRGARALPNAVGTAPGIAIRLGRTPCYALPGVPLEMYAMFTGSVEPELRAATAGAVLLCRKLNTFGLGESELGALIADLMARGRNPEVGTTAGYGVVGVRINAAGPDETTARRMLDQAEAELRARLGEIVFGVDDETLAVVVGRRLAALGRTVSTAESCTGGMIAAALTDIPGSSAYFRGGVVAYANEAKTAVLAVPAERIARHGAVSAPVAEAMAAGVAARLGTDYALAVTGIAGPTGGTADKPVGLVFIGLRTPRETTVREFRFGHDAPRDVIRQRATHAALNMLRLAMTGIEGPRD